MAYVTDTGLQRKTLQEVRLEIEQALRNVFGMAFETSVDSPNGLLISQLALSIANLWELAQEVYVSRDLAQAQGVTLDWLSALSGIFRKAATACTVEAMLYTEDSSVTIPAGSRALRTRGSLGFTLDQPVAIDRSLCEELLVVDDGSKKETEYVFHFTFGDVTLDDDSSTPNIEVLKGLIEAEGASADITPRGLRVRMPDGTPVGITGQMPGDFVILAGAIGGFTAEQAGYQTCAIGELDTIPVAVSGWDGVYNYVQGIPGSDRETDSALRVRQAEAVRFIKGRGTDPSIAAHLVESVPGVTAARVVSNRTFDTDAEGRPPKSFETLVVGGTDEDVARAIWDSMPSGIEPYGNTSVQIVDDAGDGQTILFSRPQARYLWVRVAYSLYAEEQPPTDAEIKAALMEWAEKEYQMGVDVIPSRVLQGLYNGTTGIGTASVRVAVTDTPDGAHTFGTSEIPISSVNYAVLANSRIVLVRS